LRYRFRNLTRKLFASVTVMFIPHNSGKKPFSIKLPSVGIAAVIVLACAGLAYTFSISLVALEYKKMNEKLTTYSREFFSMRDTILSLKKSEAEFRKLFSFTGKEDVLKNMDVPDQGDLDVEALKKKITETMTSVKEIREYLSSQKSLYDDTPRGWPTSGYISSPFGPRVQPITGLPEFHTGVDISTPTGTPVRATANGIVTFAAFAGGSGNLVVLEHGFGYSSFYAHNSRILVHTGQVVKRNDVISLSGSTGNSTGPHLHYEVWKNKKPINPEPFLMGKVWQ
jgi:murein DD-endopeptidase MepM/ murein hydrolase activator NlpD